jgi:hypothetical protein
MNVSICEDRRVGGGRANSDDRASRYGDLLRVHEVCEAL